MTGDAPPEKDLSKRLDELRQRHLVFFLDLDGTLVPLQEDYRSVTIAEGTQKLLCSLNEQPGRRVVIVSGRAPSFLEQQLGGRGMDFGAEHGGLFYEASTGAWLPLMPEADDPVYAQVKLEMESAETAIPGSDLEEKSHSLAWHYRQAQPTDTFVGSLISKLQQLVNGTAFGILQGNKVIEAKPVAATKEAFIRWYLRKNQAELEGWVPITIGDDKTDEDMFRAAAALGGVSVKVGPGESSAEYRVDNVTGVLDLLSQLAGSPRVS